MNTDNTLHEYKKLSTHESGYMNFEKFVIHKMSTSKARIFSNPDMKNCINLEIFLEYELQASSRYRRYVSVVLLKGVGNGASHLKDSLSENIRNSDASFSCGNYIAVLMGETDDEGSRTAIERYRRDIDSRGHEVRFAYVTYPGDGKTVDDLNRVLLQRIEESTIAIN
jgi:hypothetical protein